MEEVVIAAITAVLGGVAKLLQNAFGLSGKWVGISVIFLSLALLLVAAYDAGGIARGQYLMFILTWFNMNIAAAGGWHLTEESQKKMGVEK